MHYTHNVYLDCDQVFSDFVAGMFRALNFPYAGAENWQWGRNYNIFDIASVSKEKANKLCTIDFWENLPWTGDGKEILEEVWARFRPNEVMLLTKPMEHDDSFTGKAKWVRREIPELHKRMVPTWIEKAEFAFDFNCLLIDDSPDNVEAFTDAGGAAILVPRPWNQNDYLLYDGKAVSYIAEKMDKWIETVKHPAQNRKESKYACSR